MRTKHLNHLENCACKKEQIDKSIFSSISTFNGKSTKQTIAETIRINLSKRNYIDVSKNRNTIIVPPRNKF